MKRNFLIVTILVALIVVSCSSNLNLQNKEKKSDNLGQQLIPVDSNVTIGKLDNGLTYYIRKNSKPENRLAVNLVVNAGAVLEDENQRGLAHLCEHMAFNGTKHFEKQELVSYLESIGMKFGAELNAYTGFDETVYMLNLPTDNDTILEKGFQVLDDWASNVSYEDEEIDKERGVVHEEWRSGRGAGQRIRDKFLPVLFHDSKYASRLPIGLMDVVDNCSYETLRKFYNDWYRPDLMAVVAVGDYEKEDIEKLIKKYFSDNKNPDPVRKKDEFFLPNHDDTKYVIATDKEMTRTVIYLYIKHEIEDKSTLNWFRNNLIKTLFTKMLNARYNELIQKADPPFLGAFAGESNFIRTKRFFSFGALVKETEVEKGLETLLKEVKRVENHGFLINEMERTKKQIIRSFQSAYNEKEKTNSNQYANEYKQYFLTKEPIPGIEWSYEQVLNVLPTITLEEVNNMAGKLVIDENRVVILSGLEKEGLEYPTEKKLDAIVRKIKKTKVEPYREEIDNAPLISHINAPGKVVSSKKHEVIGISEFELSNGIKVFYKVTDFQDDQILMRSFSPGGHSLANDSDFIAASNADQVINISGIGTFDNIALQKKLSGKKVSCSPYIGELEEGINGSSSIEDLETMFQLTHLYFTSPRKDDTAFKSLMTRQIAMLENRKANPMSALQDTLTNTLTQNHFRSRPITANILKNEMNLEKSFEFYKERFADADDFTFFFVGNIDPLKLIKLCKIYLGSLPTLPRVDKWKDINEDYPKGKIVKEVKAGIDPKSTVAFVFNGKEEWSIKNKKKLTVTKDILNIMLREKIREEESGTYGVSCSASLSRFPENEYQVIIYFGCDPERAETLSGYILDEIEKLKTDGPSDENMIKVKTTSQRSYEKNLENNKYWLNKIVSYEYNSLNLDDIYTEQKFVEDFTKDEIKDAANKYFDKNMVKVTLFPEE